MTTVKAPSKRAKKVQESTAPVDQRPGMRIEMVPESSFTPPILPPPPPNPTILAFQEQILHLVCARTEIATRIAEGNARLRIAQAEAESARKRLVQVEQEVQYRLGIIAQLEGKPAVQGWASGPAYPDALQPPYADVSAKAYASSLHALNQPQAIPPVQSGPFAGMGSIPPAVHRPPADGVEGGARTESAESIRAAM